MIAHRDIPLVEGDDIDYNDAEIGDRDENELEKALEDAIRRAAEHLPNRLKKSFGDIVLEYKDIFRICLGADPPVDVPPMEIKFEGTECLVKVQQRTYSPDQLDFMKKKCDELLKVGYFFRNPSSKWGCAPLIFPKDGLEEFRFTIDLPPSTPKPRSMCGRCLMRTHACQANWSIHLLPARCHTWLFAIPSRQKLAKASVIPYAFWVLHTEPRSTLCHELRLLLPIDDGIVVLSTRSVHLGWTIWWVIRRTLTAFWRRSRLYSKSGWRKASSSALASANQLPPMSNSVAS